MLILRNYVELDRIFILRIFKEVLNLMDFSIETRTKIKQNWA